MILRDPVHGLVEFDGPFEALMMALLATPEVQRLRRVRQLGLTSLVFPGAEHSRFAHALGSAHLMVRLLSRIEEVQDELPPELRTTQGDKAEALAAALLHDIGHGPFSHLFEVVMPNGRHHEEWTYDAILDPAGSLFTALEGFSAGMAQRVVDLLKGQHRLAYLSRSVSGTIDVDRSDYLLRDSQMTGVRYGLYDIDWMLRAWTFAQAPVPGSPWVLAVEGRKGLQPIEGFFLGRAYMYQQVYHHKATRAAEAIVRAIFIRVAELAQQGHSLSPMPPALAAMTIGKRVPVDVYLELDDVTVQHCFSEWARGEDPLLADLCQRFRRRELFKTVPLPDGDEHAALRASIVADCVERVEASGGRSDLMVALDIARDVPYAEPTDTSPDGIWVRISHRPVQRLGEVSFILRQLRNKRVERARLIFPPESRAEVESVLDAHLRKS